MDFLGQDGNPKSSNAVICQTQCGFKKKLVSNKKIINRPGVAGAVL